MTVFMVETYVVKPEKHGEYMLLLKRFPKLMKKKANMFKVVKSYKVFAHMFGGVMGGYVELYEFNSLADVESLFAKVFADKEIADFHQQFMTCIEPSTYKFAIWNPVE